VKFPMFGTYDSFAAPTGEEVGPLKGWADVDLEEVKAKLASVVEEAKANDPKELRKRIFELERQLKQKSPSAVDPKALEAAEAKGRKAAEQERRELENLIRDREGRLGKIASLAHLNGEAVITKPARNITQSAPVITKTSAVITKQATREVAVEPTGDLSGPEQRILNAIAWLNSIGVDTPEQTAVAFLAGYTYGAGGFNNPRGSLRVKGLVEYVGGNRIRLTAEGQAAAQAPDAPLTTEELHSRVLDRLPGP
jgi:hypothetical protein